MDTPRFDDAPPENPELSEFLSQFSDAIDIVEFFGLRERSIVFDMSRLVIRRHAPRPTGIDRIELTFAKRVLERPDSGFVVVHHGVVSVMPHDAARRFVAALDAAWHKPASKAVASRGRSAAFRGAPLGRQLRDVGEFVVQSMSSVAQPRERAAIRAALRAGRCAYLTTGHHGLARYPGKFERFFGENDVDVAAYVHDLIPIRYPEFQRPGAAATLAGFLDALARRGATFTANSHATADDLRHWLAEQGYDNGVRMRYPPLSHLPAPRTCPRPSSAHRPYFVVVGTVEPRKNHLMLLNIWRRMAEDGVDPMPKLVIAGYMGWLNDETRAMLERSALLAPYIEIHDALDDAALFRLIANARSLLFPSFVEGLGLPLIEARCLGAACVAADIPAFREIATSTVQLLDPTDGVGWRTAIENLCQ